MLYYIIKPKDADIHEDLKDGIKSRDAEAQFVKKLELCDIAVLQKGWTRSKLAIIECDKAIALGKQPKEEYLYTYRFSAEVS